MAGRQISLLDTVGTVPSTQVLEHRAALGVAAAVDLAVVYVVAHVGIPYFLFLRVRGHRVCLLPPPHCGLRFHFASDSHHIRRSSLISIFVSIDLAGVPQGRTHRLRVYRRCSVENRHSNPDLDCFPAKEN